jgi:GDSL-like Lipase/Acylhydrolase family
MSQPRAKLVRILLLTACIAGAAAAKDGGGGKKKWVASWTTSPQNTFAGVNAPRLVNLAFPFTPASPGVPATVPQANNQTLRMIVKPDLWGDTMRVRLSNYFGTGPVTFGKVALGLQSFSGATVAGTNRTLTFGGKQSVTVEAGKRVVSDQVKLSWVRGSDDGEDADDGKASALEGRNLAVSMFIPGQSGPMTFHNTALQESFLGAPNSGDHASDDSDKAYPYETSSWFFVDAVDVMAPSDTRVLVGAGSSSVDGSITTPGNNDRFLNWMSRRLHAAYGNHVSVVNAGIGGDVAAIPDPNATPPQIRPLREVLAERFDRDVLGASGVTDVVFYAGTNDFGDRIPPQQSIDSLRSMVEKLHRNGVNAIGATLISNVHQNGTTTDTYKAHDQINQFILHSGVFDSTADFFGATIDPNNIDPVSKFPVLRADYQIHSDPDGTPDFLHLGRNGAQAEAETLDIGFFAPSKHGR